ncbi:hypothetical protein BGZ76_006658 [Entomortierella beljakovae]|nr:hypothetical protein BGZ76_006658 [Entomortierella beljakovae]
MQFKEFDAFPKVESGFIKKTGSGGILTLIVTAVLCILVIGEIKDYMTIRNDYSFHVDPLVSHELQVNIDITIASPCDSLTIDLADIGGQQLHLTKIHKIPTHFTIGASHRLYDDIRNQPIDVQKMIRAAHRTAAVEKASKQTDENFKACRMYGSFDITKIAGNLHITSVGHGYPGVHTDHVVMNLTHRIDEFSFGELYPSIVNPLDDSFEISEKAFEAFQYFILVVPTIYQDYSNKRLTTNQYSVSEYRRTYGEHQGVPGLFFKYDFEPMTLLVTEELSMSFGHFLVRLAGLVGGYYVTAGAVHKVLSAIYYYFKPEQISLRKHNV